MSWHEYDFRKIGMFLSVVLIIIGGVIGGISGFYYYNKYKVTEKRFREASVVNQSDVQALVEKVGKLIKLPDGELPTIATVTDLERLKNQPFFAKAKIGDKVLLYTKNKKAILYDPLNNLIVEVGPLIIPTPSAPIAESTGSSDVAGLSTSITPSPNKLKVAIYNSTNNSPLVGEFETLLIQKIPDIELTAKTRSKKSYAKSVVIDLTGNNKESVENIAKTLDLEISALSSDEVSPSGTDILI